MGSHQPILGLLQHFYSALLPISQKEEVRPTVASMLPKVTQNEGLAMGSQDHRLAHVRPWGPGRVTTDLGTQTPP